MSLDRQLGALLSALDGVLDLDRGLADATLSRAHTDLVTHIGDSMDLDAGLARVVPLPDSDGGLAALADELARSSPAKRLAARVRLPVRRLIEARTLAVHLPRVRSLADWLGKPDALAHADVCAAALLEVQGLLGELDSGGSGTAAIRSIARHLSHSLTQRSEHSARDAESYAHSLAALCRSKLSFMASQFEPNTSWRLVDNALAAEMADSINRILSALTSMIGADLTAADLTGIPLDGVRWSPATRWPHDWNDWVRDNSVHVSDDVFEIRAGSTGTRVPT